MTFNKVIYIDKYLPSVDKLIGISGLSTFIYLFIVFISFFILSIIIIKINNRKELIICNKMIYLIFISSIVLYIIGFFTSYNSFHYTVYLILAVFLSIFSFYFVFYTYSKNHIKTYLIYLFIFLIFFASSKMLINGIEEQETSSDTINIFMNGFFRWSIHAFHYDLAPTDAITKVIMLRVTGINYIFDPTTITLIYFSHGLVMFMILYILLKNLIKNEQVALALIGVSMFLHPYSTMVGLSIPPVSLSQSLSLIAVILVFRSLLLDNDFTFARFLIIIIFITYSILTHPSALGLIIILITLAIILIKYDNNIYERHKLVIIIQYGLLLYFLKILYTGFTIGFINYLSALWNFILNAFNEETISAFTARNLRYFSLPRSALTGFAVFPAIVVGYTFILLTRIIRTKRADIMDVIYITVISLYGIFFVVSYLTGVGGVSQSRILFNVIQPYMELVFLIHLLIRGKKYFKININRFALLFLMASLSTVITPNMIAPNYTIPTSIKSATINDHIIAYTFFSLLDKDVFLRYYSNSEQGGIVIKQVYGDYAFNLASTQAVVYYYIVPGILDARSYWDPRIINIFKHPPSSTDYIENRVFAGWVYEFTLYTKE